MESLPLEIVKHISSYLDYIRDVSIFSRCCKLYRKHIPVTVRPKDNLLMLIVNKYLDIRWSSYSLTELMLEAKEDISLYSINWDEDILAQYMPLDYIFSCENIKWNGYYLSQNPNVTMQTVLDHPEINWDAVKLSAHPNITWEDIVNNPQIEWNYKWMSTNPNITWKIVRDNPDKKWKYAWLCYNTSITLDDILSNTLLQCPLAFDNPNVTWEDITNNPQIPWQYSWPSRNPHITWEVVRDNPDKNWEYNTYTPYSNITWDIVLNNSNKDWNYREVMKMPGLTWEQLITIAPCNWDIYWLLYHRVITLEIFEANLEFFTELIDRNHSYYAPEVRYPNL